MADHASPHSVATHATALLSGEEASSFPAEGGAKALCRYSPHDAVQVGAWGGVRARARAHTPHAHRHLATLPSGPPGRLTHLLSPSAANPTPN